MAFSETRSGTATTAVWTGGRGWNTSRHWWKVLVFGICVHRSVPCQQQRMEAAAIVCSTVPTVCFDRDRSTDILLCLNDTRHELCLVRYHHGEIEGFSGIVHVPFMRLAAAVGRDVFVMGGRLFNGGGPLEPVPLTFDT